MLVLSLSLGSAHSTVSTQRHDPRFGAAYLRYRGTVRGALAQLGVPEAERDDLAQEVFVVLLRQLGRLAADEAEAGGLRA
ncbi:MAG: sigma-70 family RNA polymerase sigma factor, partial [Deltaproteobacteria bacterium]|nr:sigma-70 family RNA polymerase sigma factor [Nannocystaceae bacterium]